jgi:hypothetical protein
VSGAYPATYTSATGDGELLRVADPLGGGANFSVRAIPLQEGQDATSIATQLAGERGTSASFYRVTETEEAQVAGRAALRQRFSSIDTGALVGATPQLTEGIDYIIIENGRALVVSMSAAQEAAADAEQQFERFVRSLSF